MFNIALINHEKIDNSRYIEALKEKQCELHYFELNDLDQQICKMDGIIIKESSIEEIGEICELIIKIRSLTDRFIWVLSNSSTKTNRIVYLQLGSDGTFDKQVDPDEFGIYIGTTLERRSNNEKPVQKIVPKAEEEKNAEPIELVPNNFSVNVEAKGEVSLTKLEFQAMEILVNRKGDAVSYEEMYQAIWGDEKGDRKYRISNLIFHLRKKLGDDPFKPKYIRTIRSRGYMLSM
jgi:DNA-binding response OmpR family regulator